MTWSQKSRQFGLQNHHWMDFSMLLLIFTEDAGLCGLNGCPFHGMCLRDAKLSKYQCQCPECYTQDMPNYVCGESINFKINSRNWIPIWITNLNSLLNFLGNDGVTYESLCHLHQASCLLQKPIIFDYDGHCSKYFKKAENMFKSLWSDS